jgi:hypothetical protein
MQDKQNCSDAQRAANQANAEKSTGPRTEQGKQTSRRNATRHALTGNEFTILHDENEHDYQQVLQDLKNEHQPVSLTEDILVLKLAQAYWLGQRAIRRASADMDNLKQLALMMRYQAMHDRAFQSTLKQLLQYQQLRQSEERGEHLVEAATKSIDLDAKIVRLHMLRARHDAYVARQDDLDFRRQLNREIADLTRPSQFAEERRRDHDKAA